MSNIDLFTALDSVGDIRSEILTVIRDIIEVLEEVSGALQFSVDDIEGMLGDLISLALDVIDFVSDVDVDEIMSDIAEFQQELAAPVDEILAVLYEAEAFLTDPLTLDSIFTTSEITVLDTSIREEFEEFFILLNNIEQIQTLDPDDLTDMILDAVFNSPMFQELNAQIAEWLIPVKEMLYEQATVVLDKLNEEVDDLIEEAAGAVEGAESEIKNVKRFPRRGHGRLRHHLGRRSRETPHRRRVGSSRPG